MHQTVSRAWRRAGDALDFVPPNGADIRTNSVPIGTYSNVRISTWYLFCESMALPMHASHTLAMVSPRSGSPRSRHTQGLHGFTKRRVSPNAGSPWFRHTQGFHGFTTLRVISSSVPRQMFVNRIQRCSASPPHTPIELRHSPSSVDRNLVPKPNPTRTTHPCTTYTGVRHTTIKRGRVATRPAQA